MSIYIFRRDFRIEDNIGLIECDKNSDTIYPIFIFTPEQVKRNKYKSSNAIQFMIESLEHLSDTLDDKLTILYGNYIDVLKDLISNYDIESIYTNTDYTPYAIERDEQIEKLCEKMDITCSKHDDICLLKPGFVLNNSGNPYQKFTPFYKKCLEKTPDKPDNYKVKKNKMKKIKSKYTISWKEANEFYKHNDTLNINGGRTNALEILKDIKDGDFKEYNKNRNQLIYETTQLSGYLKFGCVSIREVYDVLLNKYNKNNPLIRQLYWRDFYYQIGYHFPKVLGKSLKSDYDKIKWSKSKKNLKLWQTAKTGFPIIDACMTQLNTTGYMHNRGRLIVSSFLIKNLHIDWRKGEQYFASQLLDYDPLVNNGNWQWMSGSGADSQQYIRIFNPWTQSSKFDSDAEYIKTWLPVFKDVESKDIHNWEKNHSKYNIDYPKMIIDYKDSREKTLKIYKKALTSK